jgi:hypothetical protein
MPKMFGANSIWANSIWATNMWATNMWANYILANDICVNDVEANICGNKAEISLINTNSNMLSNFISSKIIHSFERNYHLSLNFPLNILIG